MEAVLSTKIKRLQKIMALAIIVNGLFCFSLIGVGIWISRLSTTGIDSAQQREEFAAGMLLGGVAWSAWLSAIILAALTLACWRIYLKVERSGKWRLGYTVLLTLALIPSGVLIAAYVLRSVF